MADPSSVPMTFPEIPLFKVPEILKKYGIRPDKKLGQVFLCDLTSLRKVIEAAEITPDATILEIGAGIGNLTRYLAEMAGEVFAVEKDLRLLPVLTLMIPTDRIYRFESLIVKMYLKTPNS